MSDITQMAEELRVAVEKSNEGKVHPMNHGFARHRVFDGDGLSDLLIKFQEAKSLLEEASDDLFIWENSETVDPEKGNLSAKCYMRKLRELKSRESIMTTAVDMVFEELEARMESKWRSGAGGDDV